MSARSEIILSGLEVARRVCDLANECAPTLFAVRSGGVDWNRGTPLESPSEYWIAAQKIGASSVVLVGSHLLVDPDHQATRLVRIYAGLINAEGVVLIAGKQQRWHGSLKWSAPSIAEGAQTAGWLA